MATVSESRIYMVLYMGAVMAVVMLGFMWGMYPGRGRYAILAGRMRSSSPRASG